LCWAARLGSGRVFLSGHFFGVSVGGVITSTVHCLGRDADILRSLVHGLSGSPHVFLAMSLSWLARLSKLTSRVVDRFAGVTDRS
jgi:hypothetical protein